jgi:polyphosphate kinase 2 (PPK2 family)
METEKSILQMLELMLARQEEAAARQEAAEARQEKRNAEAKVRHERLLAILDGWKSYGKGTPICQTEKDLFRRNGRHNIRGESRRNRGRSGAAGSL